MKNNEKKHNDWRLWIILAVSLVSIFASTVANYAVLKNDVKHLQAQVDDVKQRVDKIFDYLMQK